MPRPMTDVLLKQVLHRSADAHGVRLSIGADCCDACAEGVGTADLRIVGDFAAAFAYKSGETVIVTPLTFAVTSAREARSVRAAAAAHAAMADVAAALRLSLATAANGGIVIAPEVQADARP